MALKGQIAERCGGGVVARGRPRNASDDDDGRRGRKRLEATEGRDETRGESGGEDSCPIKPN